MNVRTRTEFGAALKRFIEASEAGKIPNVSDSTATPDERNRVKADTIRRWCRGEHEPGALELARVALVIRVSLDSLAYDVESRPAVLSSPQAWSFSEKQMATLLEGFRALDQLNRLVGDQMDVVSTYCDAPKTTLAAILAQSSPPENIHTIERVKTLGKATKKKQVHK